MRREAGLVAHGRVNTTDPICVKCGSPCVRRKSESFIGWQERKYCSMSCYGRNKDTSVPDSKSCLICSAEFKRPDSWSVTQWRKRRYCSRECALVGLSPVRKALWETPEYRDSMVAAHNPGVPNGKRGIPRPHLQGNASASWKGSGAGYGPKHAWVARYKKYPDSCEECGSSSRKLEWSNVDHEYSRNLADYRALCRFCHREYDKRFIHA